MFIVPLDCQDPRVQGRCLICPPLYFQRQELQLLHWEAHVSHSPLYTQINIYITMITSDNGKLKNIKSFSKKKM